MFRMLKARISLFLILACVSTLVAQSGFQQLLFEDFSDGSLVDWEYEQGWGLVNDNGNNILIGTEHDFFTYRHTKGWTDYSFQCRIKVALGGAHILYRVSDNGRYFFSVEDDQVTLSEESPWGTFTSLISASTSADFREWNTTKIVGIDDSISFYINDALILGYRDTSSLMGGTFGVESFGESEVYVDSIFVAGILPDSIGYITGKVTDSMNNPLKNHEIHVGIYDEIVRCWGITYSSITNDDGLYTIQVPFGDYLIFSHSSIERRILPLAYEEVLSWNEISNAKRITIQDTDTVENINLKLEYGYLVCGNLIDTSGYPVAAGGNAFDVINWTEFGCSFGFGSDESDGRFEVILPQGDFQISFHDGESSKTVIRNLSVIKDTCLGNILFEELPTRPRYFNPQVQIPGFDVKTLIPGCPSSPVDVAYFEDQIIISAPWSGIFKVDTNGLYNIFSDSHTYGIEADFNGNLYSYGFPGGEIGLFSSEGNYNKFTQVPRTFCESVITVALDGNIWIGYAGCGINDDVGRVYKVRIDGSYEIIIDNVGHPSAIEADINNNIFLGMGSEVYKIDTLTRALKYLIRLPFEIGFHGLAADEEGNLFVSCASESKDFIYKYSVKGQLTKHCELPPDCINGIEILPNGDLVAVMRCTGSVYYIYGNKTNKYKTLIEGNGISSPTNVILGLNEELFIANDESGRIAEIKNGNIFNYSGIVTYSPPTGCFAIDKSGGVYFSESAPGMEAQIRVFHSGNHSTSIFTRNVNRPAGLAFSKNGDLLFAEFLTGELMSVSPDRDTKILYGGFESPSTIAIDTSGVIYLSALEGDMNDSEGEPGQRIIWKIDTLGRRSSLGVHNTNSFAISPQNKLFATVSSDMNGRIYEILPDGKKVNFANGFIAPSGIAFDIRGDMYISDSNDNSITKISGFPNGRVNGTVFDAVDYRILENVNISIINDYPNIRGLTIVSDDSGLFDEVLAPDCYKIIVSCEGYYTQYDNVRIYEDSTKSLDIYLNPVVDTLTSIQAKSINISNNVHFSISPNPTRSQIEISIDSDEQYSIYITSINGKLVKESFANRGQCMIDLSSFQGGIYFVTFISKDNCTTEKIVKL